jgi:hypothetical protein
MTCSTNGAKMDIELKQAEELATWCVLVWTHEVDPENQKHLDQKQHCT